MWTWGPEGLKNIEAYIEDLITTEALFPNHRILKNLKQVVMDDWCHLLCQLEQFRKHPKASRRCQPDMLSYCTTR